MPGLPSLYGENGIDDSYWFKTQQKYVQKVWVFFCVSSSRIWKIMETWTPGLKDRHLDDFDILSQYFDSGLDMGLGKGILE